AIDETHGADRRLVLRQLPRSVSSLGVALVGVDRRRRLLRGVRARELEVPRAHTRDLAHVVREVLVCIDGLLGGPEHAYVSAEGLGIRDPLAATAQRVHRAEGLADLAQRLPRSMRADPAGLVVDHGGVD